MTLYELIESEREGLKLLRSIGDRHLDDATTQRLVATSALEAGERIMLLHELLQYRDIDGAAEAELAASQAAAQAAAAPSGPAPNDDP